MQTQGSCSKKGLVYDYFYQYCPSVTLTNSSYWLNFDAGFDSSCTGWLQTLNHLPLHAGMKTLPAMLCCFTQC